MLSKRFIRSVVFGLCLSTVLCPLDAGAQSSASVWGDLQYAEAESVRGLNPYRLETARGATDRLFSMIYEGLLHYDYDAEQYLPMLAEKYTIEGPRSVTFELRENVRWHDGMPFTAVDVAFTYEYIKKLAPEQVRKQVAALTVAVVDVFTVRATFSEPVGDILQYFDAWIIPEHRFENFAPKRGRKSLTEEPVGTGPYQFRTQTIEGHVSLDVNMSYWGRHGQIETVKMRRVTDPSQMTMMALGGGHNLMIQVPPHQIPQLAASKIFNIERYPSFAIYAFAYQCRHPLLQDARVRRALTYATDRQQMLDQWFNAKGHLVATLFNNASPYFDPSIRPYPYDPEKARALLDEAGYQDRDGDGIREAPDGQPLRFNLVNYVERAATATTNQNLAASYKSDLAKVGVDVTLIDLPLEEYRKQLFLENDFDIALVEWTFDPIYDVTDLFETEAIGGNNIVGYSNPRVDDLIQQFHQTTDPEYRLDLMRVLQAILAEDNPYTFVLSVDKNAALHRSLAGYRIDPYYFFSYFPLWYFPVDFRD